MPTGDPVQYIAGGGTITPRLADDILYRKAHDPRPPKPTGLDWDKLTPTCPECQTKSGQIDGTGLCPTCRGEKAVNLIHADVTRYGDSYQVLDQDDIDARFTAPTQTPQDQATPPPPPRATGSHVATPATPGPAAPTVRAKVRRLSTHDITITLCSFTDPINPVAVAALLADLLTALTHQTPAAAPSTPAAAGPKSEGRTRVGKPTRPSDTPPKPRRVMGNSPTRRARTSTFPLAEAQRLYLEEELSIPDIAPRIGSTTSTVRKQLKAAGTPMRDDRSTHSGGVAKTYDPTFIDAVRRLYLDEHLTIAQVAERLYTTPKVVGTVMRRHNIPSRPDAFTSEGHPHRDNAGALKAQIRALDVTSLQIKTWALHQGLIERITRGVPKQALVDAYATAHPTPAHTATSTSSTTTTEGDTAA